MSRSWLVLVLWLCGSGCGVGLFQTAKTTPPGQWDFNLGIGYVLNENAGNHGRTWQDHSLPMIALRRGITQHLDLGFSMFLVSGGMIDAKYNFFSPENPWALSLLSGLGIAARSIASANVVHVPLRVLVSYQFEGACLIPYGSIGYGFFWIFDYMAEHQPSSSSDLMERQGHGDGLLMLTAGLDIAVGTTMQFLIEYNYWKTMIDDPGDSFSFVDNHLFLAGVKF